MNKKLLILLIVITLLVVAIPLTLFVINQQQDIRSNAQTVANDTVLPTPTSSLVPTATVAPTAACAVPTQVINVKMDYPANVGGVTYNFTQASCTWPAVTGATSYSIKITQIETNSVTKTDTVTGTTTSYTFAVTGNNTFKCEISAVNACGTGPAGSDQLLCKTDTTPSTAPTVTVAPTIAPTVPATVVGAACGLPCTNGTTCATGLTCVTAANSTRYCAVTAYQNACALSPSIGSCCTAPTSIATAPTTRPTVILPTALPPTGVTTTTIWLGLGGIAITIVGGLLLLL